MLVEPAVETALRPGMAIRAVDRWTVQRVEPYPVAFQTLVKEDDKLPVGARSIFQEGRLGRGERAYEVEVRAGVDGRRRLKSDQVVLAPIERIVLVGTDRSPAEIGSYTRSTFRTASFLSTATATAQPPIGGTKMTVLATAYSAGHDSGDYTANGLLCRFGVIAVDPRVIPLGTRLYVPGYGYGLAADTGGAIKGAHVDVCFDHEPQCDDWGRRTLTITIIR
jgi:3D (Asp-Asp-Asp) domain-containing protein